MSAPADLSRLRIDRHGSSAPERNAFVRNVVLFGVALAVVEVGVFVTDGGRDGLEGLELNVVREGAWCGLWKLMTTHSNELSVSSCEARV